MAAPREIFFMQGSERVDLPDPDPEMNIEDVRQMYAPHYGFLNNATTHFHERTEGGGQRVEFTGKQGGKSEKIEFKHSAGVKG